MGTHVAEAHEPAGRCRGGAWAAGTALQSQASGQDTEAGHEDPDAARLARFWADLRRRTCHNDVPGGASFMVAKLFTCVTVNGSVPLGDEGAALYSHRRP